MRDSAGRDRPGARGPCQRVNTLQLSLGGHSRGVTTLPIAPQLDAPKLIVWERWHASRRPSVPSALRGLDPRHPLPKKPALIGASADCDQLTLRHLIKRDQFLRWLEAFQVAVT